MLAALNRETSIAFFVAAAGVHPRRWVAWAALGLFLLAIAVVRVAAGPGPVDLMRPLWPGLVSWIGLAFLSWGGLWALACLGAILGPSFHARAYWTTLATAMLVAGASSLVATDVPRMFQLLAPLVGVSLGLALDAVRHAPWLHPVWAVAAGLHILFGGMSNRVVFTDAMSGFSVLQAGMETMYLGASGVTAWKAWPAVAARLARARRT